ncbi:MAG: hypothetical protein EXS37_06160 [Opitutus sp.]|nr:hypothetical protein [Opitutus sp.]
MHGLVLPLSLSLLLSVSATAAAASPPAFPGAEGAGAFTTGGRGGDVFIVTNLNASGPGSLADAVGGPNRIVVFAVSGIIDLARNGKGGRVVVAHPGITIAGQTAPGEGICLRGGSLDIRAGNVVVRHLRSRRGYIAEGDMGDSLTVKPVAIGEKKDAGGRTAEEFEKIRIKKIERGRQVSEFSDIDNILIDHCSTSWATDENLTVTHAGFSTVSWSIAAEGLDYANPNQTPPRHSEGGLWGSAAPDGRATLHHVLYAHNRLRNPRTTGGDEVPPVLTLYNNVVYNWSEYATHTGSQRVNVQWLANTYLPGPDTPSAIRAIGFGFHGDPRARVFALGNVFDGSPAATADNRLAVAYAAKLKKLTSAEKSAMIAAAPFTELPPQVSSAAAALAAVLANSGATLPARDLVDARIVASVRARSGRVIEKESDLAPSDRWPDYRTLPAPADTDRDGLPDFWEQQFGLDPRDPTDSKKISTSGYAHIEHYFNNTDPRAADPASGANVVYIAGTATRATATTPGECRVMRTGSSAASLTAHYTVSGDAAAGRDYAPLSGQVTIPAGSHSVALSLVALPSATDNRTVTIALTPGARDHFIGCPSQALVVIRR